MIPIYIGTAAALALAGICGWRRDWAGVAYVVGGYCLGQLAFNVL